MPSTTLKTYARLDSLNTKLLNQIAARPYFLIVLTPGTLTRCVEAGDWLGRRDQRAIGTKRVVVPLFTAQFDFADLNAYLPAPIAAELRNFHGVELSTTWFNEVIRRLTTELLVPISSEVRRSAEDDT